MSSFDERLERPSVRRTWHRVALPSCGGVQLETIGGHWDFGHNRYRLSRSVVFGHKERCQKSDVIIFERSEAIHAAKIAPDLGFAPAHKK